MEEILVLDIETTGFLNSGGLIVEIGIVKLNLKTGEIKPVYDQLVKEEGFKESHSDSWIFNNSNLKFDDVMNAKPLEKEKLQSLFDMLPVAAYNCAFDYGFLKNRGFKLNELPCPMLHLTDIMKLPGKYGSFKWPKVTEAYKWLFSEDAYIEAHRGFNDAIDEAKIIHFIYKEHDFLKKY